MPELLGHRASGANRALAMIGLTWWECQLAFRTPAFWALAAGGAAFALWRASVAGATGALAAYHVWRFVVTGLAVLAVLIGSAAAGRDKRDASSEVVLAKPLGSSAYLVTARFLGVWLSFVTLAAVMLAAGAIRQLIGGTPWHIGAYANALVRCLAPLALATCLGFSLTAIFANSLAGAVGALYWLAVPLVHAHVPEAADMTATQHWPVPVLLTAGLLALTATFHGRAIKGSAQSRSRLGWAAVVFIATGLAVAFGIAYDGEDTLSSRDPVLSAMAAQRLLPNERAPGFWALDGQHRIVGLGDFDGRPIVLAFWGPSDPESARVVTILRQVAMKYKDGKLAAIGVCLDSDSATVGPFAVEAGPDVALVWDRGMHYGDGERWSDSPLGLAYEVKGVPTVFLLDGERRLVSRIEPHAIMTLDSEVAKLVAAR
jgi:hypothetical protein